MGEAVGDPIRGIATSVDWKGAPPLVVAGSVQQVANRYYAGHSSSEEDELARSATLAERLGHGIHFSSSIAQVVMGNAKVDSFECGVAGKKQPVSRIPKVVFARDFGQSLRAHNAGD